MALIAEEVAERVLRHMAEQNVGPGEPCPGKSLRLSLTGQVNAEMFAEAVG